ncbi:hypothetical protein PAGU2196_30380 [Pseudomonas sp. PAGU 2196]|nr:hypothetical protein PAGU2196_30380 [Pseudomonas sp. PAGU 2196]
MDDFTSAGGMTDMDSALHAEMINHCRDVIGIVIHVVSIPDLAGSPMTTPVVCYNPETVSQEKEHLRVPIVRAKRPSVVEKDYLGIAWPPVFVKYFNTVLRSDIPHIRISRMK